MSEVNNTVRRALLYRCDDMCDGDLLTIVATTLLNLKEIVKDAGYAKRLDDLASQLLMKQKLQCRAIETITIKKDRKPKLRKKMYFPDGYLEIVPSRWMDGKEYFKIILYQNGKTEEHNADTIKEANKVFDKLKYR